MLRIENLSYGIGPRVLFDGASAAIHPGHRVGLVGDNGTGKTTLLRLITGTLDNDGGVIELPRRWRVGITAQEAPSGPEALIDVVMAADAELAALTAEAETATDAHRIADIHTRLADIDAATARARAARILAGLGFDEAAQQEPCSSYSGGWRMRVALAGLLFSRPDLLLLDEPTNHLDLEAALWLEDYLAGYPGTVLIVSHDRDLLNRSVDEILHLENHKLTLYQGGYDRFEATRRMRLEQNEKMRAKQDAHRAHIQKFVDRFRYKATKARQAQSRLKMLEKMEPIPEAAEGRTVSFDFPNPEPPLAPPLVSMDDVAVGYDGKAILSGLDLRLDVDDRIALLGANGNGKSTLIKLLAGELKPLVGKLAKSGKLRVGYFAQHQAEALDLSATPVVELGRRREGAREVDLRKELGRFGFTQERADTRVENLSGGEKARLLFALMSADKPHILLLDEPTNHLDIASRRALVEALGAFEGAVVLVSHDPNLVELIADRLWLVDDGRAAPYDGDMDDYRKFLLGAEKAKGGGAKKNGGGETLSKKDRRRQAAEARAAVADQKKKLVAAEKAVERLTAEKEALDAKLADPDLYDGASANMRKVEDLQKNLAGVVKKLSAAEDDWLVAQETLDQALGGTGKNQRRLSLGSQANRMNGFS